MTLIQMTSSAHCENYHRRVRAPSPNPTKTNRSFVYEFFVVFLLIFLVAKDVAIRNLTLILLIHLFLIIGVFVSLDFVRLVLIEYLKI